MYLKLVFIQGEEGKRGPPGERGASGPPGPPGESTGYDAAALAAMLGQGNTKGPDPLSDEPARELTPEQKKRLVIQAYKKLKASFEEFAKPDGDQKTPAKTCKDLKLAHPEKESGDYWIDPNGGDPKDAILAYCDFEGDDAATCLKPKPEASGEVSDVTTTERETWFSDLTSNGGFQFTYKADSNQITFLQMLSSSATQQITYNCWNSVAYLHAKRDHKRKAATLLTWNDLELKHRGRFTYSVVEDGCAESQKTWAKTVFRVAVDKPSASQATR